MILVTGATGNVGRHLVGELLTAGAKVRALTRDPATARLPGDAEVARTADMPLDGITSVFLNPAVFWTGLDDLLARAAEHGVRRVVLLSSASTLDDDPANTLAAHHLEFEQAIEDSGMEWTFTRPGEFATNTLGWRDAIRAGTAVREPYAAARTTPIHERDIAAVAAKALLTDGLVGAKPVLTGPETLTQPDMVRIIGEAIGRPARFAEIAPEDARAEMLSRPYMSEGVVNVLLHLRAKSIVEPPEPSPEVERITGRPARMFKEWAADHAGDFS
ncbi:NAD-dependent epimerase/dehydratase family protein [Actinomadura darangshiensis]|uniref:NAD-dependent epimerase/dehydratase family protein n=1 Tax=Actinomadura darangshiensis TaxID=705336 RepID=A0A4R5AB27_9ACTN|nr:NAD(P)H-binding protein [Actinomadura darangshiensis]TDD68024.1 NAD-dependent epimerase/dehydratase family protein [Actinomadura darangshiensis]